MNKIGIYTHGGSGNHGCEALLRTLYQVLPETQIMVYSQRPDEDEKYITDLRMEFCKATQKNNLLDKILNKIQGENEMLRRLYRPTISGALDENVMISIGGDNYCYDDFKRIPGVIRSGFKNQTKSVLFGCSIDEKALDDEIVLADLKQYNLITARESLTYELLTNKFPDSQIKYFPDSAFLLPTDTSIELPTKGKFVGINISPMVLRTEYSQGGVLENVFELIEYILTETEYNILLIPHVIWESNDDRTVLNMIYAKNIDSSRIFVVEDVNCCKLKGIISKCEFFIGARTHATIAAYSNCVPTIVLGYSIKSRGIAKDLFGDSDNYVVSVSKMDKGILLKEFIKLQQNEKGIREHLQFIMPRYKEKAIQVGKAICSIIE